MWASDPLWAPTPSDGAAIINWRNGGSGYTQGAYIGVDGLILNGGSSDYAYTPSTAALNITGDITIVADVTAADWTPGSDMAVVSKWLTLFDQRSYVFQVLTTGHLRIQWSTNGTAAGALSADSTVAPTVSDGERLHIGVAFDVNNGAGGRSITFFTSTDGENWSQLGDVVTTAGTTSIASKNGWLQCSGLHLGTTNNWDGTIHRTRIWNGLHDISSGAGGTLVFDADFNAATDLASGFEEDAAGLPVRLSSRVYPAQLTATNQPTYNASNPVFNDQPTVSFDGTNDVLAMDPTDVPQPYWIVAVGNINTVGAGDEFVAGVGGATTNGLYQASTSQWAARASTALGGGTATTSATLLQGEFDDDSSSVTANRVLVAEGATGSTGLTILSIGAGNAGSSSFGNYLDGDIAYLAVFDVDPTLQAQWPSFVRWVEDTYGIEQADPPTYPQFVESLGAFAWWPLDDGDYYVKGDNVVSDATGNGRTATYAGDTTAPLRWSDGLTNTPGYGVNPTTYAPWQLRSSILSSLASGSFTFGFWLRGTTDDAYAYVVQGGNYFGVGLNYDWPGGGASPGAISWLASTAGADAHGLNADVGWNDGDPHLVLFEYNSSSDTVSIWFDGTRVATRSHAGITMPTTHTNATMFRTNGVTDDWEIDEYLFFDRLLTDFEHSTLASFTGPAVHPYGATWSPPYNTESHLEIPVPGLASTEAMHPDVVDMGTAWNGYRYWMAFTPYNGDADTEVPSIVATNDIANDAWEVPAGFTNPIATDPPGDDHYADTDLLYDPNTDRLYVFAIRDDGSTFQDIRSWWTDGDGTWSSEATVLSGVAGTYGNPSIIPITGGWRLYYNIGNSGSDQLRFRESTTAPDSGYGDETVCTGLPILHFQNLNIVKDTDDAVVAVIGDATSVVGEDGRLFFARSTDGIDFSLTGEPVVSPSSTGWDQSGIYRSTVLVDTDGVVVIDGNEIDVWYSAFTTGSPLSQWGTAHIRLPVGVLRGLAS